MLTTKREAQKIPTIRFTADEIVLHIAPWTSTQSWPEEIRIRADKLESIQIDQTKGVIALLMRDPILPMYAEWHNPKAADKNMRYIIAVAAPDHIKNARIGSRQNFIHVVDQKILTVLAHYTQKKKSSGQDAALGENLVLKYEAIPLHKDDLDRLRPGELLNDSIIEFYTRYLCSVVHNGIIEQSHFFNTYFWPKLETLAKTKDLTSLRSWTKVNIFEKKYIFIPINNQFHWSLVVICNAGRCLEKVPANARTDQPVMLHFCSMGLKLRELFSTLRLYGF
eukprot:TRINITY_DN14164_c0_g1_i1.p1 TRINITY_DN14164_c0_g1~~TRINITY_DN14164_c0_g1_i1.p1  ORF type:complete len:280 (-),score=17.77 TRINITY_DN14164_c0_g1_i1:69-908(-)